MIQKPVYERGIYFGSGFPALSVLTLEPQDEYDEPVGYITVAEKEEDE